MERVVTKRLVYCHETQNDFRIGRSTLDSIAVLDKDIRESYGIINEEAVIEVIFRY